MQEFLEEENTKLQLVEHHNYRINAAERAIQTFKIHFIYILFTTDTNLLLQLWDALIIQGQYSLNMICNSQKNPHLSAYHAIEAAHDFQKNPMGITRNTRNNI